jgi:hypothetical protein
MVPEVPTEIPTPAVIEPELAPASTLLYV